MSVATYNRTQSKTEYINKIRELNVGIGRIVMNKPKKYRQNYGDAIIKSAIEALKFAQTANDVFVKKGMPASDKALIIERLVSLVKKLVIELAQYRTVEEAEKDGRIIETVQNVSRPDI